MTPLPIHQPTNAPAAQRSSGGLWLYMLAAALGIVLSAVMIPVWVPGMAASLAAADMKIFWYLSRATAIIAFVLLWFSMFWGLMMTTRLAKYIAGVPAASEMHKFVSILGLGMGMLHGLLLLGDRYMNLALSQVLVPFITQAYRPLWVEFGKIAIYLWGLLVVSFYLRKHMGAKAWRSLHAISFITFMGVMLHGIASGTDTGALWMTIIYWASGGSLLFLLFLRLLNPRERVSLPAQGVKQ
jgi:predicted ferric reductase